MTRDEIYEHLAKVYLGKKENAVQKKTKTFNSWLILNIVITLFILASVFYGLTAFLAHRGASLKQSVVYSLTNSPIRISYDVGENMPQVKKFSLAIPQVDLSKFQYLNFSMRGMESTAPSVVKLILRNQRNEEAVHYVQGVNKKWQRQKVILADLNILDLESVREMDFVIEAWNIDHKKGVLLVDDISFSN